jgi:WD40 repeat protein
MTAPRLLSILGLGMCCVSLLAATVDEIDIHYTTPISHLAFSSDGNLLAASSGWKLGIWSSTSTTQIQDMRLQTKDSPILAMQFSADNSALFGGTMDGRVRKWEVATARELEGFDAVPVSDPPRKFRPMVYAACFSHDHRLFAVGFQLGEVDMWELNSGRQVGQIRTNLGEIRALAFGRDDSHLAVGNSRGTILVWNLHSHEDPKVLQTKAAEDEKGWVYWLAFTRNGNTLLSSGFHPGVIVWNVEKANQASVIGTNYDWVETFDVSSDDSLLVTGGKNRSDRDPVTHVPRSHRIALWNLKTGTQLKVLSGALAIFSSDGTKLAIADGKQISFVKLPISNH